MGQIGTMRLRKAQKEKVLQWIAEGLNSTEINERASQEKPAFSIDRRRVDYYRKSRKIDMDAILSIDEKSALTTGLAIRENRVAALQRLAQLMGKDLFGGFLWTEETKGVGSGPAAEIIDYDEFNGAEVAQFRGVLEDIAKEMGGRATVAKLQNEDGSPLKVLVEYVETPKPD
jgi:hypothetical protein